MNRNLCLAACFLPLNQEHCSWWLRLQDELAARDLDLVLLSTAPAVDERLRVIVVPLWLQGFAKAYGATENQATLEAPLADALARRDRSWLGQDGADLAEFKTGVIACQEVFRALFEELQPALVLAWGNSLAQSVILQQLAGQQGRPCWVIERGLLPGTLMIEMAGQGGQTELNWSFNLQNTWRRSEDTGLFAAAQEICRNHRSTKYAQADFLAPEIFHEKFNPERKPLVALLLQHDAASCLVPHDFAGAKIHSPAFPSSADAITQLAAAAREANCKLIVKPHPIDQTDYSACESASVSIVRDVNLHSLIGASDVVAAMTSTAQFEALLHEKPLLLLARSALADKGAAYEVKSPAQLRQQLRAALNRENFSERQVNAKRFVTFLLQNFSVSLADEIPTGSTLADLAKFLAQNAVAANPNRSLNDRLTAAGDWMMLWESRPKQSRPASQLNGHDRTRQPMIFNRSASNPANCALPSGAQSPNFLPGPHQVEVFPVTTRAAFEQLQASILGPKLRAQQRLNPGDGNPFVLTGHCAVCGGEQLLSTDFMFSRPDDKGLPTPAWRERQVCVCGLNCRQRSCFHVLSEFMDLPESALVYCTEQRSSLFARIRNRFPLAVGSEYLGATIPLGTEDAHGTRNEDITALTYPDEAFDAVFSIDVLEHVPNYKAGLAELARCLKPGGRLLLTAPFHFGKDVTVIRAGFDAAGKLQHHLPPVYHGDPLSSEGCLCFNDFGWDLLEELRAAGFTNVGLHAFTSEEYGYIGLQYVILATREAVLTDCSTRRTILRRPIETKKVHPSGPALHFQSHIGQDAWVAECLNFKRNGFFLDFGAFDGKTISNTYALEQDLGWKGICVEPNPRYYPEICANRNCVAINVALWPRSRELVRLVDAHGLSTLECYKDSDRNAGQRAQATSAVIQVDTLNPNELLERFNAPQLIDYLSLDVEGAEFDILSALDLHTYAIALLTIEHNHDAVRQQQIRDHLATFGYEVLPNRNDDFFFHRDHLARLMGRPIDPVAAFHRVHQARKGSCPPPSRFVLDAQTKAPAALKQMGATYCSEGLWNEAGQIYQILAGKSPEDVDAWRGRIECARMQGHSVMADLIMEEALETHPEWAAQLGVRPATATATLVHN